MPLRVENGDGIAGVWFNALLLAAEGYGVEQGCGVILGGATDEINIQVGQGAIMHDGSLVSVSAQQATLQPGNPDNPRKDLVWIDREGTVRVQPGVAGSHVPPDKERDDTYAPAVPDASRLNGVPIAWIEVPPGTTSAGELDPRDKIDLRVAPAGTGAFEVRQSDPPDEELFRTRAWINESVDIANGPFRIYYEHEDAIYSFDQTLVSSGDGPTELVVEDFEDSIADNWRGGDSALGYDTPAYEGSAAGSWDSNSVTRDYSLKGDGLEYYAADGDRIRMAVRFDAGSERYIWLGFGKDGDDYYSGYRAYIEPSGTLRVQVSDSNNNVSTLGSAAASISAGEWYILEVDYDGGGRGVHPVRLYSTASGAIDTQLAEIAAPTANTDHRGTGYVVCMHAGSGETRVDKLSVIPGGA